MISQDRELKRLLTDIEKLVVNHELKFGETTEVLIAKAFLAAMRQITKKPSRAGNKPTQLSG